ncbi:MAG: hypothetical protein CEE38_17225 [Planctomycetes bacterium B3_Pla]|nr:MAG: hypothetical protein CEE38_17225 [Planctomycetes bacterium B3_Pla]
MKASQNILAKKTVLLLIVVGVAALFVIIGFSYRSWRAATDPNEVLRRTVAEGIQDNVSKLSCAVLVWNSERKSFGPWSNKPETAGNHQLWWNNNKIAILCKENTTIYDPNGQVLSNQKTTFMTYDGKKFQVAEIPARSVGKVEMVISKKPPHNWCENNYMQKVGWQGNGGLINVSKGNEPGVEQWRTEEGKVIKRTFHNTRTGQVGVWTYDIEKAHGLITYESYCKVNILQSRTTIQYKQVSGGAWFPISVITAGYNIQNGELLYRNKIDVDVNKSAFNNPSAIPEDVFKIEIGPNTEIIDLTSLKTRLRMRLNDF